MPGIECKGNTCRERKASPKRFDKRSFRTKRVAKKTLLVLACPVGKWQPRKERCKVPMQVQSIVRKRK